MDFNDNASKWAEARRKDINDTVETLARNVDADTVKSNLKNGLSFIPMAVRVFSPELAESLEQIKAAIEPAIDDFVEYVANKWEILRTSLEIRADPEIELETGIRADAELAAAAIEEATVELENEMSEQSGKDEQETAALEGKFTAERDDLVGKLDKMRDKYFENHPDLDQDQRTDAEGTFKTIKDDAVEALKADQGTRLAEREAMHQGLQENYEQRRKELEGTRARDDRA